MTEEKTVNEHIYKIVFDSKGHKTLIDNGWIFDCEEGDFSEFSFWYAKDILADYDEELEEIEEFKLSTRTEICFDSDLYNVDGHVCEVSAEGQFTGTIFKIGEIQAVAEISTIMENFMNRYKA